MGLPWGQAHLVRLPRKQLHKSHGRQYNIQSSGTGIVQEGQVDIRQSIHVIVVKRHRHQLHLEAAMVVNPKHPHGLDMMDLAGYGPYQKSKS